MLNWLNIYVAGATFYVSLLQNKQKGSEYLGMGAGTTDLTSQKVF